MIWTFIRRHPRIAIGGSLMAILIALSLLAPLIAPYDPLKLNVSQRLKPPNETYWFGTDAYGRDVLSRTLWGGQISLVIAAAVAVLSTVVGTFIGLLAGYFRGWTDTVIRTIADVVMTIPGIAVLVLVATNVRSMTVALMAVIVAGLAWMYPTRTIRAQTLSMRERPYVDIARLNGVGGMQLVFTEIFPNLLPYIAASFVTAVSSAMLATIGLEALGLGPQNELTLGMMIFWAQYYGAILRNLWWWWVPPVAMMALIFIGLLMTSTGMDRLVNRRLRVES